MSNFGRAPRSGPKPTFVDPGYPEADPAKAKELKANAVLAAALPAAYKLLVEKKGCKALGSLTYRDLGKFNRGPKSGDDGDVWAAGKVTIGWRCRVTPLADAAGRILREMDKDREAIAAFIPSLSPDNIRKKCTTWLAPRFMDVAFTYGRLSTYLALPTSGRGVGAGYSDIFHVPRPVPNGREDYFDIYEFVAHVKLRFPRELSRGPLVIGPCDDPENMDDFVKYNKQASAGLPWNAKPASDEKIFLEAAHLAQHIYVISRDALDKRTEISTELRKFATRYPALLSYVGAAKDENLSMDKLETKQARLYVQTPLHLKLLTSSITRVFENDCGEYGPESSHAQVGVSFHKGGADRFVQDFLAPLKLHLEATGGRENYFRYSVAGDDTIIMLYDAAQEAGREAESPRFVRFAQDCSSFDLTQTDGVLNNCSSHLSRVMSRVAGKTHKDEVVQKCKTIAEVWKAIYTWRPTVLSGGTRQVMTVGGPSGLQLQSKVNSLQMGVICEAVKRALNNDYSGGHERFAAVVKRVGDRMGFTIKLEQFEVFECRAGFHDPLDTFKSPFLFLGYWLWLDQEDFLVYPWIDLLRLLPNMGFPKGKFDEDAEDYLRMTATRMAAYYLTAGVPPPAFEDAFAEMRNVCRMLFLELKRKGKALAGVKANFYDAHYEFLDAQSEDQDASAPLLPDDLEHLYQLVTKMDPWVYWAEGYTTPAPVVRAPVYEGPFLGLPCRMSDADLPRARAEVTFAPVSKMNYGKKPPEVAWAPPVARSEHIAPRELRKMMPQEIAEYHDRRFQNVLDEDEFGGDLPGRSRKGRSRR